MNAYELNMCRNIRLLTDSEQREFDEQRNFPVPVRADGRESQRDGVDSLGGQAQERTKRLTPCPVTAGESVTPAAGETIYELNHSARNTEPMLETDRQAVHRTREGNDGLRAQSLLPTRGPIVGTRIIRGQATGAACVASGDLSALRNAESGESRCQQNAQIAGSNPAALNPIHTPSRLLGWLVVVSFWFVAGCALGLLLTAYITEP